MTEIEKLLNELRDMKNEAKSIENTRDIWACIGNKDWEGAGFANEAEALEWLEKNEYSNLA